MLESFLLVTVCHLLLQSLRFLYCCFFCFLFHPPSWKNWHSVFLQDVGKTEKTLKFNTQTPLHIYTYIHVSHLLLNSTTRGDVTLYKNSIYKAWPWLGWLSWLHCCPINWKVTGSIPSQGTCLGCGFTLVNWSMFFSHIYVSLHLSVSPKSISMSSGEDLKKKM